MGAGEGSLKLFSIITGLFVGALLVANVTSSKFIALGSLVVPGGAILFPVTFIFGDILTETYGYDRSRKVIWIGFACQGLAVATYVVVGWLPAPEWYQDQEAYDKVLGVAPRIAFASMVAYFCGEFLNSAVLSRMKFADRGKRGGRQAWRFVASTAVGQAVDTTLFVTLAFAGVHELSQLATTIVSEYVLKVCYEIVALPASTRIANWVKKVEGVDAIDDPATTRYNPFAEFLPSDAGRR